MVANPNVMDVSPREKSENTPKNAKINLLNTKRILNIKMSNKGGPA